MSLVAVASPQNESELAVMLCLLEANNIPAYVQNNGYGGLLPGPQINIYNARRIMVPGPCEQEALETLKVLVPTAQEQQTAMRPRARDKLRMVLEFFFLGWWIPGYRWRRQTLPDTEDDTVGSSVSVRRRHVERADALCQAVGFQRCGSNSAMREFGCVGSRASTSFRYACGS